MQPTIVLENKTATLVYHPEQRIVHHTFHQFVFGEAFRAILTTGAELMEKHRATKWLSDDRGNSALSEADADWAVKTWQPRVMKAGWKYWAVVLPARVVGQMNMQRWLKLYSDQGITAQVFSEPTAALAWLESV